MANRLPAATQLAGLRAHTTHKRQETVQRVQAAIRELTARGQPVTAAAIEDCAGIGFTALRRNQEAYAVFVQHSTRLRAQREQRAGPAPRRRDTAAPRQAAGGSVAGDRAAPPVERAGWSAVSPYDPLLHRKKTWLVGQVRTTREACDRLEEQYRTLLQAHMRLEAELRACRQGLERPREGW